MKRSCRFSLPVTVVITAIGYIYVSTVFVFVDQWFGLRSSPGIMNAIVFTALTLMCAFNFAVAIYTDPGRVPATFMPDIEDADNPIHEIKRKGGEMRYCQKCSHYKPPRAHHCRVCKSCVLRMDHHCIWMNNCVGHANYKVFFVFILYAVIACIYSLVLLVGSLRNDAETDEQQSEGFFGTIYVISGLLLVPLSVALSVLLGWHIYLILQNKTTIEVHRNLPYLSLSICSMASQIYLVIKNTVLYSMQYHEGVRGMWLAEKGGDIYSHPYDLGAYKNLISALGPNILCWVCPTSRHIGSGLCFRTAYDKMASVSASE